MRSPASGAPDPSGASRAVERGLRAASLASLAALAWLLLPTVARAPGVAAVRGAALRDGNGALEEWTRSPRAETLSVSLSTPPSPAARDWLAALRRSGVAVRWSDSALLPLAAEAVPAADPAGGLRLLVAAPEGARVTVAGSSGILDSARVAGSGVAFALPLRLRGLRALSSAASAVPSEPDSLSPRGVVVLGRAGWETRFVALSLEERGWAVDSRVSVAPGIDVTQGRPFPLDTARHAAVVVLDSLGESDRRAVLAFVVRGGGLVLGPGAGPSVPGAPASGLRARLNPVSPVVSAAAPRRGLGLFPLAALRPDAVVLEERDGSVAVAARRSEAGRVVQIGYDETWRWRLSGEGSSADDHRAWWAAAVSAAAYRPAVTLSAPQTAGDPAPYAALVAALGESTSGAPASSPERRRGRFASALAALCLAALVAETASRRLRGAP